MGYGRSVAAGTNCRGLMAANTHKINVKSVLAFTLLPGIIPRAKTLAGSGFGYLSFLFAQVFGTVRILPPHHPYLNPDNIGRFGLIKVMAAAANNIEFSRRNADQIILFGALMAALMLVFLQFVLIVVALFSSDAYAQTGGKPFESMFRTEYPTTDIAFLLLDYVFGIPATGSAGTMGPNMGFFGSAAIPNGPTPFHQGLHALFNFYNLAILLVGVVIFLYYVIVVVIETAQTGVPFGRRFSKLYAPFRLIFAVGALVPLNYGFNGAQYITLYAARIGSSFATNGWILYNRELQNPTGGENAALVAKPRGPGIDDLSHFASVYHACREMYGIWVRRDYVSTQPRGKCIQAYVIHRNEAKLFASSGNQACQGEATADYMYADAVRDFKNSDVEIVLGEKADEHKSYAGSVRPYCGKMTISMGYTNPAFFRGGNVGASSGGSGQSQGVEKIEEMYFNTIRELLKGQDSGQLYAFTALGERMAHSYVPTAESIHDKCWKSNVLNDTETCKDSPPKSEKLEESLSNTRAAHENEMRTAYQQLRSQLDVKINTELERRGWGGAGIWYNNIADVNGTFTGAIYAAPSVRQYPQVMERVKNARLAQNKSGGLCTTFEPNLGDGKEVAFEAPYDPPIANVLNKTYQYFACERRGQTGVPQETQRTQSSSSTGCATTPAATAEPSPSNGLTTGYQVKGSTSNAFVDAIGLIFGVNGLFDLRSNSCWDSNTGRPLVHPLAQLSVVGKSLIENAIRSMGMSLGAAFGGGMIGVLSPALGASLEAFSGMFVSIATLGLTAGFLLYYILPFLPFIYFFFAVGAWVKSIFEAMVGVPLWALAHLRIDGDGFSGRAAFGGYFLILEIFLRPIVTLFGLIGGMAIFTAMAGMLNNLFDIAVINATGATPDGSTATVNSGSIESLRRGMIDQFFFTIMYAVLLYMMATACFKMIDTVPNGIMRWLSSGVPIFNDNKEDPTAGLTQYAAVGGNKIAGQVFEGLQGGVTTLGRGSGGLVKEMMSGDTKPRSGN